MHHTANPYKIILRKKIIDGFRAFSRGDYRPLLALYDDHVHQIFEGDHAVGGERHSKEKVELWFQRFLRLLPSEFEIQDIFVTGMPWNTRCAVQFQDRVTPKGVMPYTNQGVMLATIRWGKAVDVHIYVDTEKVANALRELAKSGVEEASLPPIE